MGNKFLYQILVFTFIILILTQIVTTPVFAGKYGSGNVAKKVYNVQVKNEVISNKLLNVAHKKDTFTKITKQNFKKTATFISPISYKKDNLYTTKKLILEEFGRNKLLSNINKSRAQYGLSLYTNTNGLNKISDIHANDMKYTGLKHTDDNTLKYRVGLYEKNWSNIGENVGVARNVKLDEQGIEKSISAIHMAMMSETAPQDGHKRIILSNIFTKYGVAVSILDNGNGYGTVYVSETYVK